MQITMDKKYNYANGRPARILCTDRYHHRYPIISLDTNGMTFEHQKDGRTTNKDGNYVDNWALIEEWTPQDKEPVWAWDYDHYTTKRLSFYDNLNGCLFKPDGTRDGLKYNNYAKVEHLEQWVLDAQTKLEN